MSKNKTTQLVEFVANEMTFLPSLEMRKSKAAFWARYEPRAGEDTRNLEVASILKFVDDNRIQKWWSEMGFREWFLNQSEFRDRLEYLSSKALDCLEEIMVDTRSNTAARVNAAKLLMDAAGKLSSKAQPAKFADKHIGEMGQEELIKFISQFPHILPSGK